MKMLMGLAAAAALAVSSAAQAQMLAPHEIGSPPIVRVSDVDAPMPQEIPLPQRYGRVPSLLPPVEVYTVLRDNGYLPLGAPRQHGFVYTIAVIDRGGGDGRLVIDARDGRIIRFMPAFRMGANGDGEYAGAYSPPPGPMRPIEARVPRPPAAIPHVASRTVPVPKPSPLAARSPAPAEVARSQPAPTQQAAVTPPAQATPQTAPQVAAPTVGQAAPPAASAIQPTQEMPKVQGLE